MEVVKLNYYYIRVINRGDYYNVWFYAKEIIDIYPDFYLLLISEGLGPDTKIEIRPGKTSYVTYANGRLLNIQVWLIT